MSPTRSARRARTRSMGPDRTARSESRLIGTTNTPNRSSAASTALERSVRTVVPITAASGVDGSWLSFRSQASACAQTSGDTLTINQVAAQSGIRITSSLSGGITQFSLINTSNTASSDSRHNISVAGASAGDPYIIFDISAVLDWAIGVDNSDSDKFKISASSALGTSDKLTVTTSGHAVQIADSAGAMFNAGYLEHPRVTGAPEKGKMFATAAGFTLNTGFAAGDSYYFYNDSAANFTITQGAGLTLRLAGTASTGNRTLTARGMGWLWVNSSTEYILHGTSIA